MNNKLIIDTHKKLEKSNPKSDPYPLIPEVDPQIRIHVKMKWIRNNALVDFL